MISIQELDNPTQLKDLDYICELAEQMLSGRHLSSGGSAWRTRVKLYREMLQRQIAQAEAKMSSFGSASETRQDAPGSIIDSTG